MTNPTSNFGWQMPTSTDLVTDLPADFAVFGQAVDTSMADLKGGTTGQVLSKATNTDMDFTWVAQDDSNAIQNAIVDAKGDLIAATGADTPARLAVGTNGQTLIADSTTATGLKWGTAAAGDTGPSFSAYRSGSTQSIPASTYTKAAFNTEDWDTNSAYDNAVNYRFTPLVAGYYSVAVNGVVNYSTADTLHANLYKNGSAYKYVASTNKANGGGDSIFGGACMVYLNGSTDYIELYFYSNNTTTAIPVGSSNAQFSAALVRTA